MLRCGVDPQDTSRACASAVRVPWGHDERAAVRVRLRALRPRPRPRPRPRARTAGPLRLRCRIPGSARRDARDAAGRLRHEPARADAHPARADAQPGAEHRRRPGELRPRGEHREAAPGGYQLVADGRAAQAVRDAVRLAELWLDPATTFPAGATEVGRLVGERVGDRQPAHLEAAVRPGRPARVGGVGGGPARGGPRRRGPDAGDARPDGRPRVRQPARQAAWASSPQRC